MWPLFGLEVATPRLLLRYVDDDLASQLARLAARGIHDPAFMPFAQPWTDVASPQLERNTLQWYWRCRAETAPGHFHLAFAVLVDDEVVGTTSIGATDFGVLRQFESGSWLGRAFQGRGLGTEMRLATLQLGFEGLGAELATTSAFSDNGPSLGVTRRLGYMAAGTARLMRRGEVADSLRFQMAFDDWRDRLRRPDIEIRGLPACRDVLGVDEQRR